MVLKIESRPHGKKLFKVRILSGWAEDSLTISGNLYLDSEQKLIFEAAMLSGAEYLNSAADMELIKVISNE